MRISPINTYNNACKKPSFGMNEKTVYDGPLLVYSTYTFFFRDDLKWDYFAKFLEERYKDQKEVSIYSIGCSDGSEPYSLACVLNEHSKNPNKFFPIKASDFDSDMIEAAQKGVYQTTYAEIDGLSYYTNHHPKDYFYMTADPLPQLIPRDRLKKCVEFQKENVFKTLRKLPKDPCVILCRNFWPYLEPDERINLAKTLKKKLHPKSIIVIGAFDANRADASGILRNNGFKNVQYIDNPRERDAFTGFNVFEKK